MMDNTAEKKILERQNEELRNRQFESNYGISKDSPSVSSANDPRRDIDLEMFKRRFQDAEIQIKDLKDDLHRVRVEREKAMDKYESTLEENKALKDQIFSLKRMLLELEKKDIKVASTIRNLESAMHSTPHLAMSEVQDLRSTTNIRRDQIDQREPIKARRDAVDDYKPFHPTGSNNPDDIEERLNRIGVSYQRNQEMSRDLATKSNRQSSETAPLNTQDDRPIRPAKDYSSATNSASDRRTPGAIRSQSKPQAAKNIPSGSNILTWDNPYNCRF